MIKHHKAQWPWHGLTALVLIGLAFSLYAATSRISYEWHWNRVPQYFVYQAEQPQRAEGYGSVEQITRQGGQAQVTLRDEDGGEQVLQVDASSVVLQEGDDVSEGDQIGVTRHWTAGPIAWGLWTTLWLSLVSGVVGLLLGLVTGLCRLSSNPTLRHLSTVYVELVRGTPLLVQIFIFYFFIGTVLNLSREFAGVAALALFTGAYVAEIVRSGVQSIAKGQGEAARSLGLDAGQSMRYVILPQAFKRVLPPLAGQFISLVKDTSLVSVIAITELTKSGREAITTSFSTFEIWFCVAALYLVINLPLSYFASRLERRLAQSD
ncbi:MULTISPECIES: amino acid ABC transporter permease [Pseudomonas]|uniref:Amino acid ABC transporter permease n=1 Tax=Pseudomonas coleopterorum TaxID=1605838 RepID=A0ABR9BZL2_9PSED|nr:MULTISPECIES: amino acid ABC transporter permease [Pseudomonas]MBD8482237.1 amino acid ABC transporter permease [Pseudomonas coleopterorum]MBD8756400.1 amino acid ABC transporter permease [Pseudomonas coleopterorum]MBD8770543.1 amino acid ABC transporter permease [Pseudomonas coleopterorum]MDY1017606.1 amino acid ABC transporter permease [Pseudomonas coleopterorum]